MTKAMIHPQAICETEHVGDNTRIWAFAHILPGAKIGKNCNICDGVFIENDVVVGDAVTVKSGVQLWDGLTLADQVFVGPNVSFTNDRFPRSQHYPVQFMRTVVEAGASIGANATILPGTRIGFGAMVGAGAVILRDVPPRAIAVGNPACIVGYAGAAEIDPTNDELLPRDFAAKFVTFQMIEERRGRLVASDSNTLPFPPRRFFVVDRVPSGEVRGVHAHVNTHQLFVAIGGALTGVVDDGQRAFAVRLNSPTVGLYIPPLVWGMQFGHSPDAALLVLASDDYDSEDYISDYCEFQKRTQELLRKRAENDGVVALPRSRIW